MASLIPGYNLCGHVLQEKLGEGAYGQVWKAVRVRDGQWVAIKVLFQEHLNREQVVNRFLQEFELLKTIRHANIVEVYELIRDGEHLGMSMELVQGKPLSFAIECRRQIPPLETIGILQNILHALAHAHQLGVLHRDIKPANVLMTASAEVKLTDFGIAKALNARGQSVRTRTGFSLGTPFYMAPEVIIGARERIDHRVDIYAAGCVLYEMLTGKPPYFEASETDNPDFYIQEAHVRLPQPDPRLINSYVPDELAAVVAIAMAKDPSERFRDCRQFIAVLQQVHDLLVDRAKTKHGAVDQPHSQAQSIVFQEDSLGSTAETAENTSDSIGEKLSLGEKVGMGVGAILGILVGMLLGVMLVWTLAEKLEIEMDRWGWVLMGSVGSLGGVVAGRAAGKILGWWLLVFVGGAAGLFWLVVSGL